MTLRIVIELLFLSLGCVAAMLSVIGVLRSRDTFAALHCASLATVAVPACTFVAVLVTKGASTASVKTLLFLAACVLVGPISSHALARAFYVRSRR